MKTRVLAALSLATMAFVLVLQSGCTVTRTASDNARLHRRLLEREMLMLVEDVNAFLLLDHPTRLSKWHYKN